MQENSQDVLTVEVFNKLLAEAFAQFRIDFGAEVDEKIAKLDQKMMSGFEAVFSRFEKLENKIDNLIITKLEEKIA